MCQHGKWIIENYEFTGNCDDCFDVNEKKSNKWGCNFGNMEPFFNHGLGCVTYGTRDAEKKAKQRGLTPIQDVPFNKVAKSVWPDHPLTKKM